jgi:hypothetical protein
MPSLHTDRGRTVASRVEIDTKSSDSASYQARRRRGDSRPFRAVAIRNGMPDVLPYVYRGTGHDAYECRRGKSGRCGCM